eukprot:6811373-Prymnesium_polylepis.1
MASSSSAAPMGDIGEMQQLIQLQKAGLLAMPDFLQMASEVSKTTADHLVWMPVLTTVTTTT